jgi:hypothetical protein
MKLLPFEVENSLNTHFLDEVNDSDILIEMESKNSKNQCCTINIISILSFHWVYDTIKKSKKNKNLKFSYLGDVSSNLQPEQIFKEVEIKWYDKYYHLLRKNNSENKNSVYPLFMTLIKANFCLIIFAIILYVIISILDFLGIIMFKELLRKFKEYHNENMNDDEDVTNITFLKSLSLYQLIILMIAHKF